MLPTVYGVHSTLAAAALCEVKFFVLLCSVFLVEENVWFGLAQI